MPRIRTIKPQFWEDTKIGKLSLGARLLFIGCWNLADDGGLLTWDAKYLRGGIFRFDDAITNRHLKKWMEELTSLKIIAVFADVDGETGQNWGLVVNMRKHQNINRPQKSQHPEIIEAILKQNSLNIHGAFTEHSVLEEEEEEEGNKESSKEEEGSTFTDKSVNNNAAANNNPDFQKFMDEKQKQYPYLDIREEWRLCQQWWSEGKKRIQRPKSALENWLKIAKEKKFSAEEKKGAGYGKVKRRPRDLPDPSEYQYPPGYDPELRSDGDETGEENGPGVNQAKP